jgi:SAM-dependent methyltransferase
LPAGYTNDLAYIHDAGFGSFARDSAPGLLQFLRRAGLKGGKVVDLGCGSGIWARALCDAGFDVLGFDLSLAMIALARVQAPQAEFRVASFLSADLPPCIAVTAIGEIFSYVFDQLNNRRSLGKLFNRIHKALSPGGLLLFDVAAPGRVPGGGPTRNYREGDDWACMISAEEDRRKNILTRRITSFRKVGDLYRRDQEVHRLQLFRRPELAQVLRRAGFRVRALAGYGRRRFVPGHIGFLARKP